MYGLRLLASLGIVTFCLAACSPEEREVRHERGPMADTLEFEADSLGWAEARPPVITDTLWIEGFPDAMELSLFRASDEAPDPFSTYIPPDWRVEVSTDLNEVTFRPDGPFGEEASVQVRFFDYGVTIEQAVERIEQHVTREARPHDQLAELTYSGYFPGALREYVFTAGPLGGGAALVQGPTRLIEVFAQYPIEAGDGFGPRQAAILQHWRWNADGSGL